MVDEGIPSKRLFSVKGEGNFEKDRVLCRELYKDYNLDA